MAQKKHIMIVCGEPSGDLHAGRLAKSILELSPEVEISGVGGLHLRQAEVKVFRDIKEFAVIGFFDVLRKLPSFISLKNLILKRIKETKPEAIILVDFSGFNLRLAKAINKLIPVIYYVSPQVWASRPGRIKTIARYIDRMIVFFEFEAKLYRAYGIDAACVGHPLLDIVRPSVSRKEFLSSAGLSESGKTICLMPGSRTQEIRYILPIMLEAACLIKQKMKDVQFVVAKPQALSWQIYDRLSLKAGTIGLKVVEDRSYDCLNAADFCMVASGTATLETAILKKPFVIIYKMSALNYLLYRPQVRIPFIGIVNIVAGRRVVPEFIQFKARPADIADEALRILNDPSEIQRIKSDLAGVKSALGESGASLRAAQTVLDFLEQKRHL